MAISMVDPSLIATTALFAGIDPDAVLRIAATASEQRLRRRDVLFRQGEPADFLYVVVEGRIAISNEGPEGKESMVAIMTRRDLFGEMGLFDRLGRSATARALERSVVAAVPYSPIRALYEDQPSLLWPVVRLLAGRLRGMDNALADTVFLDVDGRTAKRLLQFADGDDEFQLPVTQEELAQLVGASRERVNKAISRFVRLGWITQSGRTYVVANRERLEWRAGPTATDL